MAWGRRSELSPLCRPAIVKYVRMTTADYSKTALSDPTKEPPQAQSGKPRPTRALGRFLAGIFVLLGGGSVPCPCCGQTSCPGATASAGFLAGMLAGVPALLGSMVRFLKKKKRPDVTSA
jgi:hypothetical protein